jgi:hypothetical protein
MCTQAWAAGAVDISGWPEVFTNHSAIYISADALSKAIINAEVSAVCHAR